ncbi:hypothetical protein QO002_002450 [Pararhizobium capsulatum DSM 1112]|uniref:Uncharacterized protein n=1 Tax=Pararhizobium capsulatum DSM 1112 TaxID=1121113 RepID=A0ABU0BQR9_9HYPH|nr:hypothetical protein [Pararhizobium capsulatum]MDQ0320312.1 hypothetical protein [Pararhizobium capsulatum DSM 1112]
MAGMPDFDDIKLTGRPLIVCDIDEVVLEFVTPFRDFLRSQGHDLLPRSFRLTGNVVLENTGEPVAEGDVKALLEAFFLVQESWQVPAPRAVETLESLARDADLIFLTAMPPRHTAIRRALLDRHDLHYPLLATEDAKGPVIRQLTAQAPVPTAFLDDIARNLHSVRDSVPDCLLIHLMANEGFRRMAPPAGDGVLLAESWDEAEVLIRKHFFGETNSDRR